MSKRVGKKKKNVSATIDYETMHQLEAFAKENDMNISAIVRRSINYYLKDQNNAPSICALMIDTINYIEHEKNSIPEDVYVKLYEGLNGITQLTVGGE